MTRIDLQLDTAPGHIVFAFECDSARQSGGYRSVFGPMLTLPLQPVINFPPQRRAEPLLVGGTLRWNGENDGIPIAAQPWVINQNRISILLTDGQLERIEERRAAGTGQALFDLSLRALALVDGTTKVLSLPFPALLVIPRDEWVRILDMMGHGVRRLIELPPPPSGLGGLWDSVADAIARGTARLAAGDGGVALGEARTAIERVVEAIGDELGLQRAGPFRQFGDRVAGVLRERHTSSGDSYGVLANATALAVELFGFASEPAHQGFGSSDRQNAEFALSLATTLYCYTAKLSSAGVHVVASEPGS
jgi:hypothetical protein